MVPPHRPFLHPSEFTQSTEAALLLRWSGAFTAPWHCGAICRGVVGSFPGAESDGFASNIGRLKKSNCVKAKHPIFTSFSHEDMMNYGHVSRGKFLEAWLDRVSQGGKQPFFKPRDLAAATGGDVICWAPAAPHQGPAGTSPPPPPKAAACERFARDMDSTKTS